MHVLWSYTKGFTKEIILAPSLKLLEACFELFVPLAVASLIDRVSVFSRSGVLILPIVSLLGFAIFGYVVAVLAQYYAAKVAVGVSGQLTQDLFAHILTLPKAERETIGSSSLVNRLTSDILMIQTALNQVLRLFLRAPIIVFGALIMAFSLSPSLSVWFLLMILLLVLLVYALGRFLDPLYQKARQAMDRLVLLTREQLEGMLLIRVFGRTTDELADFEQSNQTARKFQSNIATGASLLQPLTFLIVNLTLLCLLASGYPLVQSSRLSQGMMVALVNYLLQILTELLKMTMLWQSLNQGRISWDRLQEIFALGGEKVTSILPCQSYQHILEVENLTFTYPDAAAPALSDITFTLNKGCHLGIIGGTGSGKTTLIQLLAGLYPISNGKVCFSSPYSTALVSQKSVLFKGTIRSNLLLGQNKPISDRALWEVLDMVEAAEFVRNKVGQLDAPVDAFGKDLSGGQRQRLTIARAILKDSPVLLLDDATSALDYMTERRLLANLTQAYRGKTLIVVSQRSRVMEAMDMILLLDKGKQVAYGTHAELLVSQPLYQALYQSQEPSLEGSS